MEFEVPQMEFNLGPIPTKSKASGSSKKSRSESQVSIQSKVFNFDQPQQK